MEKKAGWWQPVLFAALAGGMGWGIRGQYGHETGAMIAGLLVSLTLIFLLCPRTNRETVFRAAAWGTFAMGFGGTMTYGQTLGLTHDPDLIGNAEAWRWGMTGCAVKGGIWIGLAGVFLGMGLGGVRYKPLEILMLMLAMVGAYFMGSALLNEPFNPAAKELPALYFSDAWHWEPREDLTPRREYWGGLLFALATAVLYSRFARKDGLALHMAIWGVIGGAIGFPLGQSLQSYHAWHREAFTAGFWAQLDPHMNWWNMMEITFGATMGAFLGLGLWLNRAKIEPAPVHEEDRIPVSAELGLLVVHIGLLLAVAFVAWRPVDALYDLGLIMGIIPMTAIIGGKLWPYLQILPLTLLPIAGKTLRQLVYKEEAIGVFAGWSLYLVIPLLLALAYAVFLIRRRRETQPDRDPIGPLLLFCAWLYFLLNYAFFRFPWPWTEWTGRTPSGIIFVICIAGLTLMVIPGMLRTRKEES
jgi:hypothetical protein